MTQKFIDLKTLVVTYYADRMHLSKTTEAFEYHRDLKVRFELCDSMGKLMAIFNGEELHVDYDEIIFDYFSK